MFKKKVKTSNYLNLYLNITKVDYTEKETEQLVNTFVSTLEEIFPSTNLKYDIGGHGYGISKGSGFFGIKALRNKFEKNGYLKMHSIACSAKQHQIQAGMAFLPKRESKFISFYIVAPFEQCEKAKLIEVILKNYKQISSIDYGYGYEVGEGFYGNCEGYVKKSLFSRTLKGDPNVFAFENKLALCLTGKIRHLSESNILNIKQSEFLKSLGVSGIKSICGIDTLFLSKKEILELDQKARVHYV